MNRVSAELARLALRQSGHEISPSTLRMWVHRGHITRGPGGYDLAEILDYLDRRAIRSGDLARRLQHDHGEDQYSRTCAPPPAE